MDHGSELKLSSAKPEVLGLPSGGLGSMVGNMMSLADASSAEISVGVNRPLKSDTPVEESRDDVSFALSPNNRGEDVTPVESSGLKSSVDVGVG